MRFQVRMVSNTTINVFWNVAECSLVYTDRYFREAYCLQHHSSTFMIEAVSSSGTLQTAWCNIPQDSHFHPVMNGLTWIITIKITEIKTMFYLHNTQDITASVLYFKHQINEYIFSAKWLRYTYYLVSSAFLSNKADLMPALRSSSIRSPFWCICNMMSQPPMNSPPMKTWGIVGQFEYAFIPKRMQNNCGVAAMVEYTYKDKFMESETAWSKILLVWTMWMKMVV